MGCNGFSQQLSEVWDHLWFRAEKPSSFILWFDMLHSTHITTLSCLDRQSCSRYKKPTYKKRERIHRNGRQRLLIVVRCGFWGHHLNVDKKTKKKKVESYKHVDMMETGQDKTQSKSTIPLFFNPVVNFLIMHKKICRGIDPESFKKLLWTHQLSQVFFW